MRLRTIVETSSHLVMVGFAGIFIAYVDLLFEARGMWPLPMLAVNLFLLVLAAISIGTFIRAAASARIRAQIFRLYFGNTIVLAPLAVVVIGSFLSAYRSTSFLDAGPRYVMYPAYSATIVLLSMLLPFPDHRYRHFRWYLLVALAGFAISVLIDVVHPGTFSILTERAAGFARNPNAAGFFLVMLLSSFISFKEVRTVDLAVLMVAATAVLATLSRAGVILLGFVTVVYVSGVVRNRQGKKIGALLGRSAALVLLGASTLGAVILAMSQRMFAKSSESGVDIFVQRWRVSGSKESRVRLAHDSWGLIKESPLWGYGSGYTYTMPQGPHNMYLSRWLDNGLLGVVAWVWLLAAMAYLFWKRGYTRGLVITGLIFLQGFFTHNMLEERLFLVMVGILLTMSYRESLESEAVEVPTESVTLPRQLTIRRHPLRVPRTGPPVRGFTSRDANR